MPDYIARMRAQMLRVLESQGIQTPGPEFGSIHSIRVHLGFVDIAFDECRPSTSRRIPAGTMALDMGSKIG